MRQNGVYIVQGELTQLITAMRRSARWTSSSNLDELYGPMIQNLIYLKDVLSGISDLTNIEPNVYLSPFLEVIRSDDTTGPITGLALTSVSKFITYGLFDLQSPSCTQAVENIADSVTHARFVGTDPSSDEVVLMKILYVLRTLLLSKVGAALTNESVCEIMQSCFRICFEMRLSELLRKSADHTLMEMVQLLFSRLPEFKEDAKWAIAMKKLKMRAGCIDQRSKKRHHTTSKVSADSANRIVTPSGAVAAASIITATSDDAANWQPATAEVDSTEHHLHAIMEVVDTGNISHNCDELQLYASPIDREVAANDDTAKAAYPRCSSPTVPACALDSPALSEPATAASNTSADDIATKKFQEEKDLATAADVCIREAEDDDSSSVESEDAASGFSFDASQYNQFVNPKGVRFVPTQRKEGTGPLLPYGLPCIRELFRFLISIMNPLDKHNTDVMLHMGLSLLTVALETATDDIPRYSSLLSFAKDEMCLHLYRLLNSERVSLIACAHRLWFLTIEAMRGHLKMQMEVYLNKLMEIISSPEGSRVTQEQKEIALEAVVHLWKIPGFVTELFLNYDCDLYGTSVFEDLTKLLSKNAFPVTGLFNAHLLALDALLAVVDSIEQHCQFRIMESGESLMASTQSSRDDRSGTINGDAVSTQYPGTDLKKTLGVRAPLLLVRQNRMGVSPGVPTADRLREARSKKKILLLAVEQFNTKAAKGISYMQDSGLLTSHPEDIARFLRETPRLSKTQIGEYISNRKNKDVFESFVTSFDFSGKRLDESLRMFLEAFRLPGESPVIEYLMEHFSKYWQESNSNPFVNADAAFTLTYAVIMLNVDQHNKNAKKQNIPMTVEDFKRNLKKCNGGSDFDADMLEQIYHAIRTNEIIMPDEQSGIVKENYMWKVIMAKCLAGEANFIHAATGTFDSELFALAWGPTVAALSFVFDKSADVEIMQRALLGFKKCAVIAAHYAMSEVFDNLVISLCKFTTFLNVTESADRTAVSFGNNGKAQMAAKAVFSLGHNHGDILRDGWKNILDCLVTLYRARLLPQVLTEVEDFLKRDGKLRLIRDDKNESVATPRSESGVMSSLLSYFASSSDGSGSGSSSLRSGSGAALTADEQRSAELARSCIDECGVDTLIDDTKFLRAESLLEFIKALIAAAHVPGGYDDLAPPSPLIIIGDAEEDLAVFSLEVLVRVVLQNRDRAAIVWNVVRDHLSMLILHATEPSFLIERAVTGLLRIAIRLLCREEVASQIVPSLRVLLAMRAQVLRPLSRPIVFGLHRLLETNAANIHSANDWQVLFTLLSVVGAGASQPQHVADDVLGQSIVIKDTTSESGGVTSDTEQRVVVACEDSDRGYTSDSELMAHTLNQKPGAAFGELSHSTSQAAASPAEWITVKRHHHRSHHLDHADSGVTIPAGSRCSAESNQPCAHPAGIQASLLVNQFSIDLGEELHPHDSQALLRAAESLSLLVRDAAHITPYNFEICVHTLRVFVQASMGASKKPAAASGVRGKADPGKGRHKKKTASREHGSGGKMPRSRTAPTLASGGRASDDEDEDEPTAEALTSAYHQLSMQLLELIHTLHTRAASIFGSWAEEQQLQNAAGPTAAGPTDDAQDAAESSDNGGASIDAGTSSLWNKCWCPLLQGIAQLCCDARKQVRSQALMYLQRALLVQDLNQLSAAEWELCFNRVLFPLLAILLEKAPSAGNTSSLQQHRSSGIAIDSASLEETRMRASTLLSKVFLQHLHPLLSLSTFTALWLTILDFMRKYMHADKSDLLFEAIPESLKNMLRVMNTAGIFQEKDAGGEESTLWKLTWECVDTFLPHLKAELFPPPEDSRKNITSEGELGSCPQLQPEHQSASLASAADSQPASSCLAASPQQPDATMAAADATISLPSSAATNFDPSVSAAPGHITSATLSAGMPRPSSPLMEQPSLSASAFVLLHPPLDAAAVASAMPRLAPPVLPTASPAELLHPTIGLHLNAPPVSHTMSAGSPTHRAMPPVLPSAGSSPITFQGFAPTSYTSMSLLLDPTVMQGTSITPLFAVQSTSTVDHPVKLHVSSCKGSEL